jgi:NAD(P)-dependent dehydrogenase (short-subunit alcohol dehydrogenase family)
MKIDLAGKKALVTGGARGIGRACATLLAEAGARVAVADLNLAGAQETVANFDQGLAIRCDLSDPADVAALCAQALTALGGVDILVNCAGLIAYHQGIASLSLEKWDQVLDVNLRGTFLVCQGLIEDMKRRRSGKIINFSSLAARVGGIEAGAHYAASKAGLIGLTRTLAKEGGPYGITANAVAPGIITTGPVRAQIGGHEEAYITQTLLKRLGTPEDVANVVLFLASPLSDYVTGIVIDINGGMYMG